MAKPLLPKKPRGPGRSAARVKPGDVIRGEMIKFARGTTIGGCHREYTKLKLEDWQRQMLAKTKKENAINKIMARKRAPGNVTYENFSKFFHLLKQLGYIEPVTIKNFLTGETTKKHPEEKYLSVAATKGQIEPPVVYHITDLGQNVEDWNNPKKDLP